MTSLEVLKEAMGNFEHPSGTRKGRGKILEAPGHAQKMNFRTSFPFLILYKGYLGGAATHRFPCKRTVLACALNIAWMQIDLAWMQLGWCLDTAWTKPAHDFWCFLVGNFFGTPCTLHISPPHTLSVHVDACVGACASLLLFSARGLASQGLMRSPLASTRRCKRCGSLRQRPSTS